MKKLNLIYNESHGNDTEISIVVDPYTNNSYCIFYHKDINIIFNNIDDLFKFNYLGGNVNRSYLDENVMETLYEELSKPFNEYLEWIN